MNARQNGTSLQDSPAEGKRIEQTIRRIHSMLSGHHRLGAYAAKLQVTIENATVILRGELPSDELRNQLLPTIRQAGVLWRVKNQVDIA